MAGMMGVGGKVLAALRALIADAIAPTVFHSLVRYRVIQVAGDGRLALQIVRKAGPFPDVLPISIWPGVPGGNGAPTPGSICLVQFIEGDPMQPIVTHFATPADPLFVPVSASLDASGTLRLGASAATVRVATGSSSAPADLADAVGRPIRYGDTANVPGVGDVVLGPPAVLPSVAKVKLS